MDVKQHFNQLDPGEEIFLAASAGTGARGLSITGPAR